MATNDKRLFMRRWLWCMRFISYGGDEALAARTAALATGHVGAEAAFVEEDQAGLGGAPCGTRGSDIGALLLRCVLRLFLGRQSLLACLVFECGEISGRIAAKAAA